MRRKGYGRVNKRRRRRGGLRSSNWGPVLALLATVLGVLGAAALIIFVVLPRVLPLLGVDYRAPFSPTPSPAPVVTLPPTPEPIKQYKAEEAATEVVFTEQSSYSWFGDPCFYNGVLLLSAGKLVDNKAQMSELCFYYPESRTAEKLPYQPQNNHFMHAKFNDRWLVYLDAKLDGGGKLMAVEYMNRSAEPILIKDIYTGQPEVMLDGDYIAFTDRTGTNMDKLFVCDLNTRETAAVAMFSNSVYGQSLPSLRDGLLTWADAPVSGTGNDKSSIYSIRLGRGDISTYDPGVFVHDVESNGKYTAWLSGNHGPDTGLYYSIGNGVAKELDTGVVEFGLDEDFIAYSKNQTIYAYSFKTSETFQVSPEGQLVQFLGVSDRHVIWMDVTSRDISRDIVMFAEIP